MADILSGTLAQTLKKALDVVDKALKKGDTVIRLKQAAML